jgi:hemolysin III
MVSRDKLPNIFYRLLFEPVNSLTHLLGALLSIAGLIILVLLSRGEPWRVTSFVIYGGSLIILYAASTLYHALKVGAKTRSALKRFDHIAIFGLIAGTYTPITLVTLQGERAAWGWSIFGVIWGFALLGVIFKLCWLSAPRWLYTGLYLLMGWLALIAIVPIAQVMPAGGLFYMGLGGLFYTVGAVIYALKRPNFSRAFGFHELWHLFVLAGSISHFVMMLRYVAPA